MKLDSECRTCLYNSQLKKVKRTTGDGALFEEFKRRVKLLCDNPPERYCAPLLARDINLLHLDVFGVGIDYSAEKSLFNLSLLKLEGKLFSLIISSPDPIFEGLKYAMAANYIDFARLADLNESSIDRVIAAAQTTSPDKNTVASLKSRLQTAKTLCYLHDNCGEIVLDKLLIRTILSLYPNVRVTSVVRGKPIINDVTEDDALEVSLNKYATIITNGTDVPGTYLPEASEPVKKALSVSDVIISKGLGNLETLYGEGYNIFYAFTCKCEHISKQFNAPVWSSVFVEEV